MHILFGIIGLIGVLAMAAIGTGLWLEFIGEPVLTDEEWSVRRPFSGATGQGDSDELW